jgi:hypothetical protein
MESYHEGRPIIRESKDCKRVLVLCPYGHLLHAIDMKDWAGSLLEARATDPNWTKRCYGTLPKELRS